MDMRTLIEAASTITVYHGGDHPEPHDNMYFSSDPSFASDYGNPYQYKISLGKLFDSLDPNLIEPMLPLYDPYNETEIETIEAYMDSSSDTWEIIEQHLRYIKGMGYDSIRIYEGGVENYFVFNKANIKVVKKLTESEMLDEISRPPSRYEAEHVLKQAGYKKLGQGVYADVYAKPNENTVLKLFNNEDTAYQDFVYVTISNPNPHFPKFKGKMMKVTDDYSAIRMERLTPLPDNSETAAYAKKISHYTTIMQSKAGRAARMDTEEIMRDIDEIEKDQPGIKYACAIIGHNLKGEIIDIHNENIMMRGNVLVITDPVI